MTLRLLLADIHLWGTPCRCFRRVTNYPAVTFVTASRLIHLFFRIEPAQTYFVFLKSGLSRLNPIFFHPNFVPT